MQRPGELKIVKKKIHARAKRVLWHGIGIFVWAVAVDEERLEAAARNSTWEKGEQKDK